MKPRLIKSRGIWLCSSTAGAGRLIGYGYTFGQAYRDWLVFYIYTAAAL